MSQAVGLVRCPAGQGDSGYFDIIEGARFACDLLGLLVSLSCDKNDIIRPGRHYGVFDGQAPITNGLRFDSDSVCSF